MRYNLQSAESRLYALVWIIIGVGGMQSEIKNQEIKNQEIKKSMVDPLVSMGCRTTPTLSIVLAAEEDRNSAPSSLLNTPHYCAWHVRQSSTSLHR